MRKGWMEGGREGGRIESDNIADSKEVSPHV